MKSKKYKLEKSVLKNLYDTLNILAIRARHIKAHITIESTFEEYYYDLLSLYYNAIFNYMHEVEKLIIKDGNYYLISQELLDKINNYKKIITGLEDEINRSPRYSLKVH